MSNLDSLRTANDVAVCAGWLFGRPFAPQPGVVQVAAVYPENNDLMVLRIRDETPRSSYDVFMLSVARARADAIVTTGKILREEPGVRHHLFGSPSAIGALEAWGREVRGRDEPRISLVLTRGVGFPADHGLLDGATRVVVVCPREHADAVRRGFPRGSLEVVGVKRTDLQAVIEMARHDFEAKTVLLEAGPATVRPLYDEARGPDELMLSEYTGGVPDVVRGDRLGPRARLIEWFGPIEYGATTGGEGDSWRFAWLVRPTREQASVIG